VIESNTPISEVKLGSMNLYQSVGAGITYYRRYSLQGMLGIAPDQDIDANEDPAPASVSSDSKAETKMTEKNYDLMKASAKKYKAEGKNWSQIEALMENHNIVIDTKLFNKIKKELDG